MLSPNAIDITFPDRSSACLINPQKIENLNLYERKRLVEKFYNDTFLVDQNACSSPQIILWEKKGKGLGKKFFWDELYNLIKKKYILEENAAIEKYTSLCKSISNLNVKIKLTKYENLIYIINLKKMPNNPEYLRGKWGLFYEYDLNNLKEINIIFNKKFQTLSYFGVDKKNIKKIIFNKSAEGIDRVVPIGQCLDIGFEWDGYNLNEYLTRTIKFL